MSGMIRWNKLPLCLQVAHREFRAISHSYSVLLVLVGGVFLYGLLYNYMYAPNVVREVPVAIVDHSCSSLSRQYIRWLDATPHAAVRYEVQGMSDARELMASGKVFGILYFPDDFETRFYEGLPSVYPFYVSTDAFLYYECLEKANLLVMEAMDEEYRTQLITSLPLQDMLAVASQSPVTVVGTALYNPVEGYGIYLIPSVLMIIIFQTLMMLIAMLAGNERSKHLLRPYARLKGDSRNVALGIVCGKSLTYAFLYSIFSLFLVGLLPLIFNIPHAAPWYSLVVLFVPYILATSYLGLALSRWYTDAEAPVLLIAFFSVGLIFLSGVSYPLELMPWYWRAVHYMIPAAPATLAFVKLNAMNASLADIDSELWTLWVQLFVYFFWSVLNYRARLMQVAGESRRPTKSPCRLQESFGGLQNAHASCRSISQC